MAPYLLKRLFIAVPTLWLLITICFFLVRLAPGGPFDGERVLDPIIQERLLASYDLDKPLWQQYTNYLKDLLHGDLGPSFKYRDYSVNDLIAQGFPISLRLGLCAITVAIILGISIGTLAAWRKNSFIDSAIMMVAILGIAIPNFVKAPLFIFLFAIILGWLPAGGWADGAWQNMILPVIALALPHMAVIARLTRANLIEVLHSSFIRTARAKGLSTFTVLTRHALRPALLPIFSYLGPAIAGIITGAVVVEHIFQIPGLGTFLVQGAINRDYTTVLGLVILLGSLMIICNLIVDILYAWLDPTIRY